ncbi:MAG: hypothetical protein Q8891_17425 [Bacteroidota bacterium]|nr:hypothetical protein [Bacteroidota bacterium]
MEAEGAIPSQKETPTIVKSEIKDFYKKDVLSIIRKVLLEPVSGTYSLFENRSEKSFNQSLILMASAALVSMAFVFLIIPSQIRQYAPWFSMLVKSAFFTIVFLLLVSLVSFCIKLISGKASFKNELLTGALCAIPFTALIFLLFFFSKIMMDEQMISSLAYGGYSEIISKAGIFLVFVFYIVLLFINILLQSLRASGTKDALAWYLSPIGIFLAFYLTIKIVFM